MLQYQCSWRQGHGHWDCVACEALEDHASQHGWKANSSIIRGHMFEELKLAMMPSTSDVPPQDIKMAGHIPRDDQAHIGDPKEMDLVDSDNSEAEGSQPSRASLSPKKKQRPSRKGTPGAPSVKGRDLDTFFPKMRKWIVGRARTSSHLPDTIRFDNLDQTLTHYREQALSFLVPLAEQLLPDKPKTTKGRKEWHKRLMFKQRAQYILRERLKPSQAYPI